MRLTSRSLALLLSAIGAQSFAPPRNKISSFFERCAQPSSLSASSSNELSGILSEYKSGAAVSTVSSVETHVESTIQPLTDAVNAATDAAEQASQAAAAVMASAAKVSCASQTFCFGSIFSVRI